MKKTILTLLAFMVFGALAAGSMDSDKSSSESTPSSTGSTNSASAKGDNSSKEQAQKDSRMYIGDTVGVGRFAVLVHTPEVKRSVGNQYLKQEANGEYWIIPVSIRNDDKEARMVTSAMFKLVSSDGASFDPDASAAMYLDSKSSLLLDNINPGIQVDGYIVFDMPKGQKVSNYVMEVNDAFSFTGNSKAIIQLTKKK